MKGMLIALFGVLAVACGAAQTPAPGRFSECTVLSYVQKDPDSAASGSSSTGTVRKLLKSVASPSGTLERTWVVRSSSNSNVTYAVKQTVLAATGSQVELCSYTPNRVLVTLEKGESVATFTSRLAAKGLTVKYELMKDADGNAVYVVESSDSEHDVVETMTASIQDVGYGNGKIYPDTIYSICSVPNDPYWSDQWNMEKIGAPEAWDAISDASDVVVGVLDTGINYGNIDLNENLWTNPGEMAKGSNGVDDDGNGIVDDIFGVQCIGGNLGGNPMDDKGHGSHCAGIIGAVGNNGFGVAGIAWNAKIMGLKFCDANGNGGTVDAIRCLNYAEEHGARIINCSWIVKGQWDTPLAQKIEVMGLKGILFVCAAGNANKGELAVDVDFEGPPTYPACYTHSNVISVAATDADDELASFSFWGERSVDIAAPGVGVKSTVLGNMGLADDSGTSMAAPHVTGALALLMAYYPDESPYALVQRLYDCGDEIPSLKGLVKTGKRLSLKGLFGLKPLGGAEITTTLGTSSEGVFLFWNAVQGASFYSVSRAESPDGEKVQLCDWKAGLTYSDTTAEPGKHYWYFVRAATSSEGAGASPYSVGVQGWRLEPTVPTTVKVNFNAAGGSNPEEQEFELKGNYTGLPVSTKAGSVFLGWFTEAEGGVRIDASCVVREDILTLYAHWAADNEPRIENLFARQRYPWNGYVDISFTLAGLEENFVADVALCARSSDGKTSTPLKTWIGDGPSNLLNGVNTFVWNSVSDVGNTLNTNISLAATLTTRTLKPSSPTSVAAQSGASTTGTTISWGAVDGATGYDVYRSTANDPASAQLLDSTDSTGYTDSTGTPGLLYYYWIVASNASGKSDFSSSAVGFRKLSIPTNVSATDGTSADSTTITWTGVGGATKYYVYRYTYDANRAQMNVVQNLLGTTTSTSYTDSTGTPGVTYYYYVRSYADSSAHYSIPSECDTGFRKKVPVSLAISGDSSVAAGGTIAYAASVTYNDNSSRSVTPTWSITSGSSYGTISASGVFAANGTTTQRDVTIAASYTEAGETVSKTKAITITTVEVTITFDANGGIVSPASKVYTAYAAYDSFPSATRVGYTFAGWFTSASGGSQCFTTSSVARDTSVLFAHWTPISYTIKFSNLNVAGCVGTMSQIAATYDQDVQLPLNQYYALGYEFLGWSQSLTTAMSMNWQYQDGATVKNLTTASGGIVTLYAVWKKQPTVNIDAKSVRYDLRELNRVRPVKNMGSHSVCWAFAALGSLESTWLTETGEGLDLSVNNLVNLSGFDLGYDDGGNGDMAMAYLLRWGGPVLEGEDPYPSVGTSIELDPVLHVQNVHFLKTDGTELAREKIKQVVVEKGAIDCTVSTDANMSHYNGKYGSYNSGNDTVTYGTSWAIIGWDDEYPKSNFKTVPEGDGAWLMKTAWGENTASNGCVYVSYYDANLYANTMYVFTGEDVDNYTAIYQHDPLGKVNSFSSTHCANVFTAEMNEKISAVGVYVLATNATYVVSIYSGCDGASPVSGTLAHSQTIHFNEMGYFTVPLDASVSVSQGKRFSVVVNMTVPNCDYPSSIEYAYDGYSSAATAAPGQSYYSSNGTTWTDLTSWKGSANFCIKAYSSKSELPIPTNVSATDGTSTSGTTISWSGVSGATKYYVYRYTSNNSSYATSIGSTSSTSYTDTTGTAGTTYYYWVKAYSSSSGSYSAFSSYDTGYKKKAIALSTALDNSSLTFTTGGSADWYGVSDTSYDGTDSARSGLIGQNQASWLQTSVTGPGKVSFRWKVSSESSYDYLKFLVDDVVQDSISGTSMSSFSSKSYDIGSGSHTLKWTYSKDGSRDDGEDCGWVDCVTFEKGSSLSAPSNVSATDGTSSTGVTVSWSSVSGATEYNIYRGTSSSSSAASHIATVTKTSYTDTSATAGTTYYYWVKAFNSSSGVSSSFSSYDTGYRKQAGVAPSAPTGVNAKVVTEIVQGQWFSGVKISWNSVANATGYKVYWAMSPTGTKNVCGETAETVGYFSTSFWMNETYYFWVKAYNDTGESAYSSYGSVVYR